MLPVLATGGYHFSWLLQKGSDVSFHHLQKQLVQTLVFREFGVEGGDEQVVLPGGDRVAVVLGEDFNAGAGRFDPGCTDEDAGEGVRA